MKCRSYFPRWLKRVELFPPVSDLALIILLACVNTVLLHIASCNPFLPYHSSPPASPKMSGPVKRTATAGADAVKPNNPLQSDFNADDTSSMDEDERYLVR